eukprot:CAMPEP_0202868722 /NCGR_PEP_ID=MMETSP1391-20130828/11035_1 /ASSEMBLY_ACC=CAM_ASM_000867 /TAXON_ID=1034604 /ORGANISM="Chlamydomonas leiostraca, Strain SAG 11-49" /LENGTH=95 /DNA_ID=CAMNT_0049548923 /DNA_START=555 /DNA_END=842 /DNA_ORIENTATION=+
MANDLSKKTHALEEKLTNQSQDGARAHGKQKKEPSWKSTHLSTEPLEPPSARASLPTCSIRCSMTSSNKRPNITPSTPGITCITFGRLVMAKADG